MTLQLLWEEHRGRHPDGHGYSRFCELYRTWARKLSPTMRQTHTAGDKLFVDYAGTTIEIFDGLTGEVLTAQLFVAARHVEDMPWNDGPPATPMPRRPGCRRCPIGSARTSGPSSSSAASPR